ncbi:hypothetical protein [Aurantibacillus circumpalustris]|uniref:hypothetical protein n=1 Tax=Aurantibacillus circumpalustris TaxID=3036359 RepID=UPI00295AB7F3|nr:hypothetical protein [Aurantibacillus circumpalustris]
MKKILFLISIISITACKTTKKSFITAPTVASGSNTPAGSAGPIMLSKSQDGIYPPGEEELVALQSRYKEVTLLQLQEGHALYTKGACINCHEPKNIYRYTEVAWKDIVDDMALKARISSSEKDAVYKYVLAIKAQQQ